MIYKHFASMEDLVDAVAPEGFDELADTLATVLTAAGGDVLGRVARAYTAFAAANPTLYDAMFIRLTRLHFGFDAVAPLCRAFAELRGAVVDSAAGATSTASPRWCGRRCTAWPPSAVTIGCAPTTSKERLDLLVKTLT